MPTADRPDQVPPGVFEALHQIGVAIGGVLEPIGLARLVAEHAHELLLTDAAGLWVFDEPSDSLRALYLDGPRPLPDARPGEGIVRRTVECRAEFVSQDGQRVGLITIVRDITERVRAEQEREALLQALATAQQRTQELLARVLKPEEHQARSARRADLEARVASLTPRELDVLRQLAMGKTNPEVGRALGLSPKAARNRVAHVLAKLGVADRTQAAVLAVELSLAAPTQ